MTAFAGIRVRSNPAYAPVQWDQAAAVERDAIDPGSRGTSWGVLRPAPDSGLAPRSVSQDTALLFFTLAAPAPLPDYFRNQAGAALDGIVARLVLDGVLEIECGDAFISGADARPTLFGPRPGGDGGAIAALSIEALKYGQALAGLPVADLANRLYCFGRRPVSPALRRRLGDESALDACLDLHAAGATSAILAADWDQAGATAGPSYWRIWRPRRLPADRSSGRFKLYVSPGIAAIAQTLRIVAEELRLSPGLHGFKVARRVDGLCRPDKIVAYFSRFDDLFAAAGRLESGLAGLDAHGVPFTAEVTRDGMLSWGVDPPADALETAPEAGSWRAWLTNRLAEYLVAGRMHDEPWRFALDRMSLDGIDTTTWVTTGDPWSIASDVRGR